MARVTAVYAVFGVVASLAVTAFTRQVSADGLMLGALLAGIRWAANAPTPAAGLGRLRTVAWSALVVGAGARPLLWASWFADLLGIAAVGMLLFVHHYRRHAPAAAA